ncbi:hypothetical protein [Vibrio parahaemolyticus]|uniref:hypothetical protein n=1 Tax=Vibrio parahaemolyticus TaxID=670 RepID=UPI00293FF6F9|nr:hypothetical protein [Vibrio parahaemolyticus]MDV5082535.1 hypothetical protein [Vibrio parahaemolyticus]
MVIDSELERFAERCLRAVGLGPTFRLVVMHGSDFDSALYTTRTVVPLAEELGFVCKVVDLSQLVCLQSGLYGINDIEGLLRECGDEQRPLLIIRNTERLLDQHLSTFHTRLRGLLDCFDTTAVIFLSSQKQSIDELFLDSSMPFYCSAAITNLVD